MVGAGFAGLALARGLSDSGHSVRVLERRPAVGSGGAAITIQPNGLAALDRLGVLGDVLAIARPVDVVRQCDPRGRTLAVVRYSELRHTHPYILGIARADLIEVLARGVAVETSADLSADAVARLGADVVVGADGVGSVVREAMGARVVDRSGPDRYVVGIAPVAPGGDGSARLICGRNFANGVVPMREGVYFWDHVTPENEAAVDAGDFVAWAEEYARRVPGAEAMTDVIGSWDGLSVLAGRTHRVRSRVSGRMVLAGDAAAAVHPHTGQGGNLALEDAVALAAALTGGEPLERALAAYARERDRKARRYVPWSRFVGRALDGPSAPWRFVRGMGYVWNRVPPVRRALVRTQAGLS